MKRLPGESLPKRRPIYQKVEKVDDKPAVILLGVRIHLVSANSLVKSISRIISEGGKARAVYVNIHAINLAQKLPWFRDFLNGSDIVYCDGFGVKWGARLLGLRIPERLSPPDWISLLAEECTREHFSLFLLGAKPGVAERVVEILKRQFVDLRIAGIQHGYFSTSQGSKENENVLQTIRSARPDVLIVGLGMPLQERWMMENWEYLEARVLLPVGALFDYMAGEFPRAPHWMTDNGLEWLGRFLVEPRRLWRRYILGNPHFLGLVLKERLARKHNREKV